MKNETAVKTKSGFITIVGRPNVGKSTLLNCLIGQKISITADKPQTTRHRIVGVKTIGETQWIYVDTPGLHQEVHRLLNRHMNRVARAALRDVDIIVWVLEAPIWKADETWILSLLEKITTPVILVINKIDQLAQINDLLPFIDEIRKKYHFHAIIPISAQSGYQVDVLEKEIQALLPSGPFYYLPDQVTDQRESFLITELIREKITRFLGKELPYATTVQLEKFELVGKIYHISAIIWVEREGQRKIMIGRGGEQLKRIATQSRKDIEVLLKNKVFLQVWVKIKEGWADSNILLKRFGYDDSQ